MGCTIRAILSYGLHTFYHGADSCMSRVVLCGERRAIMPNVPAVCRPGPGRSLQHCVVRTADVLDSALLRLVAWGAHPRAG